jgi:CYTH domain-containing protein
MNPKYSIPEIERRWLVDQAAVGELQDLPFRLIEDLYLEGTRLRLRKITHQDGSVLFKLGKKYGKRTPLSEPITTLYLTAEEYAVFAGLPGLAVAKRRYALSGGSLDFYQEPNSGLMLFELEFQDEDAARLYAPPDFVSREITNEPRFGGFALANRN